MTPEQRVCLQRLQEALDEATEPGNRPLLAISRDDILAIARELARECAAAPEGDEAIAGIVRAAGDLGHVQPPQGLYLLANAMDDLRDQVGRVAGAHPA